MPKKIQRGDPLGTSGCVCFLEKVKTERVGVKFAFCAELQNCKKSGPLRVRLSTEKNKKKKLLTVRVGLFSLREKAPTKKKKKKLLTVRVGLFSLREKAPTKNTRKKKPAQ